MKPKRQVPFLIACSLSLLFGISYVGILKGAFRNEQEVKQEEYTIEEKLENYIEFARMVDLDIDNANKGQKTPAQRLDAIRGEMSENCFEISFHENGVIDRYIGSLSYAPVGLNKDANSKSLSRPTSKEEALAKVKKLLTLKALFESYESDALSFDLEHIPIGYDRPAHLFGLDLAEEDYVDGFWQMYVSRNYRGLDCESGVSVEVHIPTGRINLVSNLPFIKPESIEENINEDDALRIASDYLKSTTSDKILSSTVRKSIAHIKPEWCLPSRQEYTVTLCFIVSTRIAERGSEHGHPVIVFVCAQKGEVIGVL